MNVNKFANQAYLLSPENDLWLLYLHKFKFIIIKNFRVWFMRPGGTLSEKIRGKKPHASVPLIWDCACGGGDLIFEKCFSFLYILLLSTCSACRLLLVNVKKITKNWRCWRCVAYLWRTMSGRPRCRGASSSCSRTRLWAVAAGVSRYYGRKLTGLHAVFISLILTILVSGE